MSATGWKYQTNNSYQYAKLYNSVFLPVQLHKGWLKWDRNEMAEIDWILSIMNADGIKFQK